ncbi:UbiA prenyltransferase family-domain-containing protein [Mycena belliarum]|uniref:UbiA prenyltransferase family-domain-containing protein n=1 Tax=Mycena belliarum TaxID=1033014 RepID=A0AAD6XX56_9AGAR|nr:UbiA prenyltransferase family-domain-containing protein [Mycena belliae]
MSCPDGLCKSPPSTFPPLNLHMLWGFPKTILLFSHSDIVPILGPSLAVSLVLAGPTDMTAFICGFIWLELHLLTFEIKNQSIGVEEDRLSKPNRPIVSGRISLETAQTLYLCVGMISVLYSVYQRVLLCSTVYMVAIYCYNEMSMSRNWFLKSFLGALGYVCYCWGTTIIFDHGKPLSRTSIIAVAISGLVHTTTGHAQDFRDRFGDAAIGRKTLVHILPARIARWSLMALVAAWTVGLVYLWSPPALVTIFFSVLCCIATVSYVLDHSVEADRNSYWWYNMWLITAHLLPIFKRLEDAAL